MWSTMAAALKYGVCLKINKKTAESGKYVELSPNNGVTSSISGNVTPANTVTRNMTTSSLRNVASSQGDRPSRSVTFSRNVTSSNSRMSSKTKSSSKQLAVTVNSKSLTSSAKAPSSASTNVTSASTKETSSASASTRVTSSASAKLTSSASTRGTSSAKVTSSTKVTSSKALVLHSDSGKISKQCNCEKQHEVKDKLKQNGVRRVEKKEKVRGNVVEVEKTKKITGNQGRERSGSEKRREKRRHREKDRSRDSPAAVKNTEEGHLIFKKADVLHERYQIKRELGEGTFGKVVLCKDRNRSEKRVAVKIIRNVQKYRDAAEIEIEILEKIRKAGGCEGSVEMHSSFRHHGHVCIVFEVLGKSVFDFLKDNGFHPFPLAQIQRMADDVLAALSFLHGMKYTHTDLKPENILFIDSEYESFHDKHAGMQLRRVISPRVKIIDFGSATHQDEHHSRVVSTRHYRAPEVIAELGWSYPCDIWSVGCILFELYTGHTMFQTHDNTEHLGMMEYILGPLPELICSKSKKRYFKEGKLDFNNTGSSGRYIRKYCRKLLDYKREDSTSHNKFFDLLVGLLEYDASERLTASAGLEHQFFEERLTEPRRSRSYKSR